jgi:hypothetical protein
MHWWLTPVILATQEAEIRRIVVQLGQIVHKTLSPQNTHTHTHTHTHTQRAGGVAQGVGLEFKL